MAGHYGTKKPAAKKKPNMIGGGMAAKRKKPAMKSGGIAPKKKKNNLDWAHHDVRLSVRRTYLRRHDENFQHLSIIGSLNSAGSGRLTRNGSAKCLHWKQVL